MKKKVMALLAALVLACASITGCTEVDQVSTNISKEADNFNVTRKLTVVNARTDTILLELMIIPWSAVSKISSRARKRPMSILVK